jgi:hypothetical protein
MMAFREFMDNPAPRETDSNPPAADAPSPVQGRGPLDLRGRPLPPTPAKPETLLSLPLTTIKRYERPLSAVSMISGFAFDNYYFGRVDHPATQIVLFVYVVIAILSILFLHYVESRPETGGWFKRMEPLSIVATQFAFGGLWSAFVIFYGRSAVVAASWPFLFVLVAMLIGNEVFRKYHSRLAFACVLLFFALFSYAIFALPVFTGTMGRETFLESGLFAVAVFAVVLVLLSALGPKRIRKAWRYIAAGALGVYLTINVFYFTNILPPLPLALATADVFHTVTKTGDTYQATAEPQAWFRAPGTVPTLHVASGEPISLYSAVFAPIQLKTKILHIWQRYDPASREWHTESTVAYPITGGREGGYRGYSIKSSPRAGRWRVNIETPDGLVIGRVPFIVAVASAPVATSARTLR